MKKDFFFLKKQKQKLKLKQKPKAFSATHYQGIEINPQPNCPDKTCCHQKCKDDELCIWYTYNKDNKHCTLWRTCNEIVASADGFVSGQKECPLNTGKEKIPKIICMIQIDAKQALLQAEF